MNGHGISESQLSDVYECIRKVLYSEQNLTLWLFGSRANGDFQKYSDVDLLLDASPPFDPEQKRKLTEKLEESDLPFKFDLVLPNEIYEPYRRQIEKEKKLLASFGPTLRPATRSI